MAIFFLASFSSSCSDQGCIEADDFGEYESQTLDVLANPSEDDCKYNPAAALTDSSEQGAEVRSCFIGGAGYSANPTVSDENGIPTTSTEGGCTGFSGVNAAKNQNLCASACVESCLANKGAQTSNEDPDWKSTDSRDASKNIGVTIRPGTKIMVRASGLVNLGDKINYPNIYISSRDTSPSSKNLSWNNSFFDVRNGQALDVSFSGKWNNGTSDFGAGNSTAINEATYNGARRAIMYAIPHTDAYDFDVSASSEYSGTKGAPLLPDPKAWICEYSGTDAKQSNCKNKATGYRDAGYTNSGVDTLANSTFLISSAFPSEQLGLYGGVIRWNTDDLVDDTYDPFLRAGVTCNDLPCANINSITGEQGRMLGSTGVGQNIEITNSYSSAYKVSFKSLILDSVCNINLTASVRDGSGNELYSYSGANFIPVSRTAWSPQYISLEPGHKLLVSMVTPATYGGDKDCGSAIAVRFGKYYDVTIKRSGFVKFTTLSGTNQAIPNCSIKGRIVNPRGNHVDSPPFTADFYEYDNFSTAISSDPLKNLSVPSSANGTGLMSWSDQVYVRKGQIIRFSPESWNGNWAAGAISRKCGVGMVMTIDPRPALLCRGTAPDKVSNPDCTADIYNCNPATETCNPAITNGSLVGCREDASECFDSNNAAYCPLPACQKIITCSALGTAANNFTKTCTAGAIRGDSTTCAITSTTTYNSASCAKCSTKMFENVTRSALLDKTMDQCYDLENYSGKVSNIPAATGFTNEDLATFTIAKGAKKIGPFNGNYGNLEGFMDSGLTDTINNNKIYKLKNALIFSKSGRLRFFMLDGNDFNTNNIINAYGNNTDPGASYTGVNGFKINLAGMLSFNNGQWLEAKLCEDNATNTACRSLKVTQIPNQPEVVTIDPQSLATPVITSPYKFDNVGNLVRTKAYDSSIGDCGPTQGISTMVSNTFYCHTYKYISPGDLKIATPAVSDANKNEISKIRLTFKIRDPEVPNCIIPKLGGTASATFDGVKMRNPTYTPSNCNIPALGTGNNGYSSSNSSCSTTKNFDCSTTSSNILNGYFNKDGICSTTLPTANCSTNGGALNGYSSTASGCVSNANNTGAVCGIAGSKLEIPSPLVQETETATKCKKEFYCASKYTNNSGKYSISIKTQNAPGSSISNVISGVIDPIVEVMDGTPLNCNKADPLNLNRLLFDGSKIKNKFYSRSDTNTGAICLSSEADCQKEFNCSKKTVGQAERMYKLIIADYRYKAILTMCFVVMITFYGVGYLMGVLELTHTEIVNRVLKIALISLFVGETGWDWFNKIVVHFFKDSADYLSFMMASSFDNSPEIKSAIAAGDYYDKAVLFSSVDKVFGMFFSQAVQKKISALLFASIFGWVYLWIIYLSFMLYVYAVANAVLLYLTAQVFISILFTLGPIFFVFTLFSQTKDMFDNWLKALTGFAFQQILLLTTLAFFNMLMYEVIKMSLGYRICWDDVWTINILVRITLMSFWTIASLPPRANVQSDVGNIGNPDGIPSLFSILFIWVIASLMGKFVTFMTDLATSMAGNIKASSMGSGIKSAVASVKKMANEKSKKAWDASGGKLVQKMDQNLFDSGKMAEDARKTRKLENAKNSNYKSAMDKAGKAAVKDLKKTDGVRLAGLSKEDRDKEIDAKRSNAMNKKGTELGLSPDAIKKLRADKGLKHEGDNLLLGGAKALYQSVKSGGTLFNSLDDKTANTKFSRASLQDQMKDANKEERQKIIDNAKSGELEVGKSKTEIAKDIAKLKPLGRGLKAVGKGIASMGKKVHDKSYDEARDELVAEGEIDEHRFGTNWSMSDTAKKAIRDRQKLNASRKSADVTSNPNTDNAVAFLEQAKEDAESREAIAESPKEAKEKGIKSPDGVTGKFNSFREKRAKRKALKQSGARQEASEKRIDVELAAANAIQGKDASGSSMGLGQAIDADKAAIAAIDSDPAFSAQNSELGKLPPESKRAKEIKRDPAYQKMSQERKNAAVNITRNESASKHNQAKIGKLTKAKNIRDTKSELSVMKEEANEFFDNKSELNSVERFAAKRNIGISARAKTAIKEFNESTAETTKTGDQDGVEEIVAGSGGFDAIKKKQSELKAAKSAKPK